MSDQAKDIINSIMDLVEHNGVAVTATTNGWLLAFKRDVLERYLAQNPNSDRLVILVENNKSPGN